MKKDEFMAVLRVKGVTTEQVTLRKDYSQRAAIYFFYKGSPLYACYDFEEEDANYSTLCNHIFQRIQTFGLKEKS